MEITIHYKGKAKNLEAIDGVVEGLETIAKKLGWEYGIINEEAKGELCPSWGTVLAMCQRKRKSKRRK